MAEENEIWYRVGDGLYDETDADECAQNYFDNVMLYELHEGEVITVEAAEFRKPKASEFACNAASEMSERAWDDAGESAEGWMDYQPQIDALQKVINEAVDKWADENNEHPKFGTFVKEHPSIDYVVTGGKIVRKDPDQ